MAIQVMLWLMFNLKADLYKKQNNFTSRFNVCLTLLNIWLDVEYLLISSSVKIVY